MEKRKDEDDELTEQELREMGVPCDDPICRATCYTCVTVLVVGE